MVDKAKVEQAIRLLLEGIGEDPDREGLKDTPDRIARMCTEIYGGLDEEADMASSETVPGREQRDGFSKKTSLFIPCANII